MVVTMKQGELVKVELGKSIVRVRELLDQLQSESQVLTSWLNLLESDSGVVAPKLAIGCHKVPQGE